MSYTVFVDGAAGTTGLRIHERLSTRKDIELYLLPEETRKNINARVAAVNSADISILCLPDAAAIELVSACNPSAKICDTSTAHRTNPSWVYGFAELGTKRNSIKKANRVSVPGCHASGFLALVAPLTEREMIPNGSHLFCHSITGYSGGGKNMIAEYADSKRSSSLYAPREYSLSLQHKHLPEMMALAELVNPPLFTPIVADYYNGMLVSVPLDIQNLAPELRSLQAITTFYEDYYKNEELIQVYSTFDLPDNAMLSANALAGKDSMEIWVLGNTEQILLAARFDNLGKGASGAAIQCMNLMLGLEETSGLVIH